jgi:hypothetical protein
MEWADGIIDVGRSSLTMTGIEGHHAIVITLCMFDREEEKNMQALIPLIAPPPQERRRNHHSYAHALRSTLPAPGRWGAE